jgi:hypothetical protein
MWDHDASLSYLEETSNFIYLFITQLHILFLSSPTSFRFIVNSSESFFQSFQSFHSRIRGRCYCTKSPYQSLVLRFPSVSILHDERQTVNRSSLTRIHHGDPHSIEIVKINQPFTVLLFLINRPIDGSLQRNRSVFAYWIYWKRPVVSESIHRLRSVASTAEFSHTWFVAMKAATVVLR